VASGSVAFPDIPAATAWLDSELPNLMVALSYAAERGPRSTAWLLADGLRGYLSTRRAVVDWLVAANTGLAAARSEGNLAAQAAAHVSLCALSYLMSRHTDALHHAGRALRLAQDTDWPDGQAAALGNLGLIYLQQGRSAPAAERISEALDIQRRCGNVVGEAQSLGHLAAAYWELGRLPEAAEMATGAVTLDREFGVASSGIVHLINRGEIYHGLGRSRAARLDLDEAVALNQQLGNPSFQAEALRCLAEVDRDSGQLERGLERATTAHTLARDTDNVRAEAFALNTLGTIHQRLGNVAEAIGLHRRALRLADDTWYRYLHADTLIQLARCLPDIDGQRTRHAEGARQLAQESGYRLIEGRALTELADARLEAAEPVAAIRYAGQAIAICTASGYRLGLAHAHRTLAEAYRRTGVGRAVREHRRAAREILAELGSSEADEQTESGYAAMGPG
jgi:tetratricopeptide (TPR) repeat protein